MKYLPLFLMVCYLVIPQSLIAQQTDDLEYRKFRITLVPGIGTNGVDAVNYTARYSFNIIAGYHGGLDGSEIGLININRYYTRGAQIGMLNISGGEMSGLQFSGLLNISASELSGLQFSGLGALSRDDMAGLQFSGLGNVSGGSLQGLQFSGITNAAAGGMQGLQFTGIANIAGSGLQGIQVSGITNLARGSAQGIQIASTANIVTGSSDGIAISGGVNYAQSQTGISLSGTMNLTEDMTGIQISGFTNIARYGQGVQVGLFNFASEFEGVPVGLISWYGNGRHQIDTWFSDGGFTHIGLKTGTYSYYNTFSIGYNPIITDRDVWRIGWTFGSMRDLGEWWDDPRFENYFRKSDFSIYQHHENKWDLPPDRIFSYRYMLGRELTRGVAFYAGPSLNLQVTNRDSANEYTWYSIIDSEVSGRTFRFWIGFSAGFQLFP